MSAFNHRWRLIVDAPEPHQWRSSMNGGHAFWDHDCTWAHCHGAKIAGEVRYDYVTGRAGRVTDSRKLVCDAHLAAWLKKHSDAQQFADCRYEDRHSPMRRTGGQSGPCISPERDQ